MDNPKKKDKAVRVEEQAVIANFFEKIQQGLNIASFELGTDDSKLPKFVKHNGYEYTVVLPTGKKFKLTATFELQMPIDIVEMLWECTHCKSEVLGRFKECTNCGKTKSPAAKEWLPDDISHTSKSVVTDEPLLKKFKAGEDWKCRYCSSLEWKVDGTCANCGSSQEDSTKRTKKDPEPTPVRASELDDVSYPVVPKASNTSKYIINFMGACIAAFFIACIYYAFIKENAHHAHVSTVTWDSTVTVERHALMEHEGFHPSYDAVEIRNLGMRVSGYVDVIDRYEKITVNFTEKCGEDCRDVPRVCTQIPKTCRTTPRSCTSNKNGSATCSGGDTVCSGGGKSCSGGGRSCTPKMCNRQRVDSVPRYRKDPVYAAYYSWSSWEWIYDRNIAAHGSDNEPKEPAPDLINVKDNERARVEYKLAVTFDYDDSKGRVNYTPKNMEEFKQLVPGTKKDVAVTAMGSVSIIDSRKLL